MFLQQCLSPFLVTGESSYFVKLWVLLLKQHRRQLHSVKIKHRVCVPDTTHPVATTKQTPITHFCLSSTSLFGSYWWCTTNKFCALGKPLSYDEWWEWHWRSESRGWSPHWLLLLLPQQRLPRGLPIWSSSKSVPGDWCPANPYLCYSYWLDQIWPSSPRHEPSSSL